MSFVLSSHLETHDLPCANLAHHELESININIAFVTVCECSSLIGVGSAAYFLLFKHTLQIGPVVNLRMLLAAARHLKHVSFAAPSPQPLLHSGCLDCGGGGV